MSDADITALVAMLRHIQCDPASFDTYSMASAAERAADAIERLRSSGGASENAVRRSEYWKGEYLAANAFINRMEAQNAELRAALFAMMQAFERRARSACQSTEEIEKQPWRCLEYVAAEEVLKLERSLPLLFSNESLRKKIASDPDDEPAAGSAPEPSVTQFPRKNGDAGWTISTDYLKAVDEEIRSREDPWRVDWEGIEEVLLAVERLQAKSSAEPGGKPVPCWCAYCGEPHSPKVQETDPRISETKEDKHGN